MTTGYNNAGTLSGTVVGDRAFGVLTPSNIDLCPFGFEGIVKGRQVLIWYTAFDCDIDVSGTMAATRLGDVAP